MRQINGMNAIEAFPVWYLSGMNALRRIRVWYSPWFPGSLWPAIPCPVRQRAGTETRPYNGWWEVSDKIFTHPTDENNLLFMPNCVIIKSVEAGGGLAQLGERLHGMQEVTSSSLVSSTFLFPLLLRRRCRVSVSFFAGLRLRHFPRDTIVQHP